MAKLRVVCHIRANCGDTDMWESTATTFCGHRRCGVLLMLSLADRECSSCYKFLSIDDNFLVLATVRKSGIWGSSIDPNILNWGCVGIGDKVYPIIAGEEITAALVADRTWFFPIFGFGLISESIKMEINWKFSAPSFVDQYC
jgi:hypothetical protein